jgi:glycerate 2-kinase
MKIIIATNSFKGSLDAFKVARAIQTGLEKSNLPCKCTLFPLADGGDHTLEVFHNWLGGSIKSSPVNDPLGRKILAEWLYLENDKTAIIEMAKASGISLLKNDELNPLKASSFGTGQLIKAAIENGAKKIILGLGGSATIDGGLGILQALGAELFDAAGKLITHDVNPLMDFHDISMEKVKPEILNTTFVMLCDVENPLLGQHGAVRVFGPQKGATNEDLTALEKSMERMKKVIVLKTGQDFSSLPGTGAAGGVALAFKTFFNASIENGTRFIISNMDLEQKIKGADLLITAEGKVDSQTLDGKGPFGVAAKAKEFGVPSIILAGRADDMEQLNSGFSAIFPITNGPMTLEQAIENTADDLVRTATQIGNLLALTRF